MRYRNEFDHLLEERAVVDVRGLEADPRTIKLATLVLDGCSSATLRIEMDARVSLRSDTGGMGTRVRLLPLRATFADGAELRGTCGPWSGSIHNGTMERHSGVITGMARWPTRAPTYRISAWLHGIPGPRALGVRGKLADLGEAELLDSGIECDHNAGTAWLVCTSYGKSVNRARFRKTLNSLRECLQLGWGGRVTWKAMFGLSRAGKPLWAMLNFPAAHWKSGITGWIDSGECRADAVRAAFQLGVDAAPRWEELDEQYGIGWASEYVAMSSFRNDLTLQARDLCIGLERLAKVRYQSPPHEELRKKLRRLANEVGLRISEEEWDWFLAFRNKLAHEGDLTEMTPVRRNGRGRLYQSVGWLRSFSLRHMLRIIGYEGEVLDFGAIPHRPRQITSRRFCGPAAIPVR